jgi:hypothetical protein
MACLYLAAGLALAAEHDRLLLQQDKLLVGAYIQTLVRGTDISLGRHGPAGGNQVYHYLVDAKQVVCWPLLLPWGLTGYGG